MKQDLLDPEWDATVDGVVDLALRADEALEERDEGREETAASEGPDGGFEEDSFGAVINIGGGVVSR